MIAILGVLTICTTKYIGKCVYRLWKSRISQRNVNTVTSDTFRTMDEHEVRDQTQYMYELAENIAENMSRAPYEEINSFGILPSQDLTQDKEYDDVLINASSVSDNFVLNEEIFQMKLYKDNPEIDDIYITPCN